VLITQFTGARLLHNEGGGKFRDITAEAGLANPHWGASAAFVDYDRDGLLDLVIVNYLDYDKSWPCTGTDNTREFCGPRTFPGTIRGCSTTWAGRRQAGAVRRRDRGGRAGVEGRSGTGVYAADLTGDGWPDIFIANDGAPNHLWVNQHDGPLRTSHVPRDRANGQRAAVRQHGDCGRHYDGDGLLDFFITHLGNETHTLWRQGPVGLFQTAPGLQGRAYRLAGTGSGRWPRLRPDGWPDTPM